MYLSYFDKLLFITEYNKNSDKKSFLLYILRTKHLDLYFTYFTKMIITSGIPNQLPQQNSIHVFERKLAF